MVGIGSVGACESGLALMIRMNGNLVITGTPIEETKETIGLQAVPTFHQ